MAGDWLKMELATPEKDEVAAITVAMGWDDPDVTVGKLFRVWRWFDQQTIDGTSRLTVSLLDRIIGTPGFSQAMSAVGWLDITESGITLPNFERHNGETAKKRALAAKRAARSRGKDKTDESNATGVTSRATTALPREEKRREEKRSLHPGGCREPNPPGKVDGEPHGEVAAVETVATRDAHKRRARSHMTPEWQPGAQVLERLGAECPAVDVIRVVPEFRDYWIGTGEIRANWDATFANRVRAIDADIRSGNKRAIAGYGRTDRRGAGGKTREGQESLRRHITAAEFGHVELGADDDGEVPALPGGPTGGPDVAVR